LEFDLTGIPRDRWTREQLLTRGGEPMATKNEFIDINKPPREPYTYQEYPKIVYGVSGTKIVNSAEEEKQALGSGYTLKPGAVAEKAEKRKAS
jgi:hypothetical protein